MKLNQGVKYSEEQGYDPSKEKRADLSDANRDRTDTERGMDDLLFGKGNVRRRPRVQQQESSSAKKPSEINPEKVTTAPNTVQTKTVSPNSSITPRETFSSIGIESRQSKIISENKKEVKKANVSKLTDVASPKGSSMTGGSLLNERRSDHYDLDHESKVAVQPHKRNLYNRPGYIRKLKKIAEDFNYETKNSNKHFYTDVVKPFDCTSERALSLEKEEFVDREFSAKSSSVGLQYRKDENILWRRASQAFEYATVFGKYIDPNDFELGRMSSANFISILSCLAERQSNIKRIIESQNSNQNNFYYIRLFINSVWRYYAVDDFLPEIEGDLIGVSSFNDFETELSYSLIEKAYAKAYGGYTIFNRAVEPKEYLKELTGSMVSKIGVDHGEVMEKIEEALNNNWTIIAVPRTYIEEIGLDSQYNLSVVNIGARGQLEIRNSWGTKTERSQIKFSREGIFELNLNEIRRYIDHILIAQTNDELISSTVQTRHRSNFYSCQVFRLRKALTGYLSVNQWEKRLFPESSGYQYSPFRVVIEKRHPNQKPQYINAAFSHKSKNIELPLDLTPGQYAIYCIGSWIQKNYDFNLSIFGNQRVEFLKSQTTMSPNLIKDCFEGINLLMGKRSAKGHVDEHIMYHKASNMVLITLTNVSDKEYNYTEDLSKIKFNTLQVINAVNQEESFQGKMKKQIADIKRDHNFSRTWNITLKPKEHYTWVISTSQDYREENFKNWGFR